MLPLWMVDIRVLQLQTGEHEQHEMLPVSKARVLGRCRDVLTEGITPREAASRQGAVFVQQLRHRVEQEGGDMRLRHAVDFSPRPAYNGLSICVQKGAIP